jgi:hypothetical protein
MVKINPLIEWSFKQVKEYIDAKFVPRLPSFPPAALSSLSGP